MGLNPDDFRLSDFLRILVPDLPSRIKDATKNSAPLSRDEINNLIIQISQNEPLSVDPLRLVRSTPPARVVESYILYRYVELEDAETRLREWIETMDRETERAWLEGTSPEEREAEPLEAFDTDELVGSLMEGMFSRDLVQSMILLNVVATDRPEVVASGLSRIPTRASQLMAPIIFFDKLSVPAYLDWMGLLEDLRSIFIARDMERRGLFEGVFDDRETTNS